MRLLILIASYWALVASKPEMYREKEDFQFSRSSSDDGTKSGYYGAQRGNMGGNYEKSHNMDSLAQHQMSTLIRNVDGELGEGSNTRTGNVFSSAQSRGLYGSGNYDLSNLRGRNFGEGGSYVDAQSQSSMANLGYSNYYSAASNAKQSSTQSQNSGLSSGYQTSGSGSQYSNSDAQSSVDNIYRSSNNEYQNLGANNYKYVQSGSQAQSDYENSNSASGYDYRTRNRLISTTPVRVYIRPGTRIAIPVGAQVYDASAVLGQNAVISDSASLGTSGQGLNYKPTDNAKRYESSYSYHKEWQKQDSIPVTVAPTQSTYPKNSELYEDAQSLQTANNQYESKLTSANSQSSSANSAYSSGYSANTKTALSSQSRQSQTYNSGASESDVYSNSHDAETAGSLYGSRTSDSTANLNNLVEDIASRPRGYQSSYSYHKSWERRGDPYIIKPVGSALSEQQSQRLTAATANQGYKCTYCLDESQQRVKRSLNTDQQSEKIYDGQEDIGQQSMNGWKDNLGQQTDNKWQNLAYLGQQTQNKWTDLENFNQESQNQLGNEEDLGQQTQNQWDKLENLGQQTQNQWGQLEDLSRQPQTQDKLEDLGQQTQNQWDKLDNLGQQTQNQWDKLDNLGQQVQNQWNQFEDLSQHTQTQDKLEDLGQQTQNQWNNLENLGQQTQNQWDNLEHLGQQTQNQWGQLEKLGQQSQNQWNQLDLSQQPQSQDKFEDLGQQTQNQWDKLQNLGQQTQSQWDKLENLGQQTQNQWDHLEHLGQHTQNQWDNLEHLGQQTQSQWGQLEELGQQSQNQWNQLEDLSQQSQSQDKLENLGQQTQNQWNQLEDLSQQTQNQWDKLENLNQQTQPQDKLEDLAQQIQNLGQQGQTQNVVNFGQNTQYMESSYGGHQFNMPWTMDGRLIPIYANNRLTPEYYAQQPKDNIINRWNYHNFGNSLHHTYHFKESQSTSHNSDFFYNNYMNNLGAPKETTEQTYKDKLLPESDTSKPTESTSTNYATIDKKIEETLNTSIAEDQTQEQNYTYINKDPTDIGRGDIGPEDKSIDTTYTDEKKDYKTPEEIESLSLTKNQRDLFVEPLNMNEPDLSHQSENFDNHEIWNESSTIIESVTTSTAKTTQTVTSNVNLTSTVENYTKTSSNFLGSSTSHDFTDKQKEIKQISTSDEQQEKSDNFVPQSWEQETQNLYSQNIGQYLDPFEEQSFAQILQTIPQHLEPLEQQNLVHTAPMEQQNLVHTAPMEQQNLVHTAPMEQQNLVHTAPMEQQPTSQYIVPIVEETLEKNSKPIENQNLAQHLEPFVVPNMGIVSEPVEQQMHSLEKQSVEPLEKKMGQKQYFEQHNIGQLDIPEEPTDSNIAQNSQTNSKLETSLQNKDVQEQNKSQNVDLPNHKIVSTPFEPTTEKPGFWNSVWNKTKNVKDSVVSWFHS